MNVEVNWHFHLSGSCFAVLAQLAYQVSSKDLLVALFLSQVFRFASELAFCFSFFLVAFVGHFADVLQILIVLSAQQIWELLSYSYATNFVEHDFSAFVDFANFLFGVHEHASVLNEVELGWEKVVVGHDALETVNVKHCSSEYVAQPHQGCFIYTA